MTIQARKEWEAAQERSTRAQKALRDKGAHLGRAAYGFAIEGERYNKKLVVYEPEAAVTREMVKRYLAGDALQVICTDLDRRGFTTKHGAKWNPKTMGQYLKRRVLYGSREGQRGVERVEAIITFDEWQAVQDRLASRANKTGGKIPTEYALLAGVAYCPEGHKLYRNNSGYYCRQCPKGDRVLIPQDIAEREATKWVSQLDEPEVRTEVVKGDNYQPEIDRLTADIKSLDPTSPEYVAQATEMGTEIQRLQSLPTKPHTVKEVHTGRTIGEAFVTLRHDQQRAFLLHHVRANISTMKGGWLLELVALHDHGEEPKLVVQTLVLREPPE